jgi:hypothetical protein
MQDGQSSVTLFIHLIDGESAATRLSAIRAIMQRGRIPAMVFADLDPDHPYAPTDWLMGPGCNCCLPARHPRSRLLALGTATDDRPRRVVIDAGALVLADRLAGILRAMPFAVHVNIITAGKGAIS